MEAHLSGERNIWLQIGIVLAMGMILLAIVHFRTEDNVANPSAPSIVKPTPSSTSPSTDEPPPADSTHTHKDDSEPKDTIEYPVSYIWDLARSSVGVRWTGRRWVPYTVGDNPANFNPLPTGESLSGFGQAGRYDDYKDRPHVHGVAIGDGTAMVLCVVDDDDFAEYIRGFKQSLNSTVHFQGTYSGIRAYYPVLDPCRILQLTDQWGEPI